MKRTTNLKAAALKSDFENSSLSPNFVLFSSLPVFHIKFSEITAPPKQKRQPRTLFPSFFLVFQPSITAPSLNVPEAPFSPRFFLAAKSANESHGGACQASPLVLLVAAAAAVMVVVAGKATRQICSLRSPAARVYCPQQHHHQRHRAAQTHAVSCRISSASRVCAAAGCRCLSAAAWSHPRRCEEGDGLFSPLRWRHHSVCAGDGNVDHHGRSLGGSDGVYCPHPTLMWCFLGRSRVASRDCSRPRCCCHN